MTHHPSFDPADLAAAIQQANEAKAQQNKAQQDKTPQVKASTPIQPLPSSRRRSTPGRWIGVVLGAALIAAVAIAISLAVQLGPESATPEPPPVCGGLYDECCDTFVQDVDYCDRSCDDVDPIRFDDEPGLFDVEENFADRNDRPGC